MIRLERVSRRFGRRPGIEAVRDVSLAVRAGEVCGIAGPNGAGKSTLLALALGFLRPTRGDVRILDERPRDFLRREAVGYVPERVQLPTRWRVGDLLRALAAARGRADVDDRAGRVLATMGLEESVERRIGELSRGLQQRVAIAQALLDQPRVLVLDEPTEGLDPVWRLRLRAALAERRAAGAAVLLASHDLGELERSADRVVLLERGAIRSEVVPHTPGGAGRYRVRVRAGGEHLESAFGDVRAIGAHEFEVAVGDAADLSARLAAWLELGGVVDSVQPLGLEELVRPAFEGDA